MKISAFGKKYVNFKIMKRKFDIFGFKDNNWHQFEKNTNYEAFLVQKK